MASSVEENPVAAHLPSRRHVSAGHKLTLVRLANANPAHDPR
jgi:hypothetical protein